MENHAILDAVRRLCGDIIELIDTADLADEATAWNAIWRVVTTSGVVDASRELPTVAGSVRTGDVQLPDSRSCPPPFLQLRVDEDRGEVWRAGQNRNNCITLRVGSAEWHTFLVAWRAGESGATASQWIAGYPGRASLRRKTKDRLGEKLAVLGLAFEAGPDLRLLDFAGRCVPQIVSKRLVTAGRLLRSHAGSGNDV